MFELRGAEANTVSAPFVFGVVALRDILFVLLIVPHP